MNYNLSLNDQGEGQATFVNSRGFVETVPSTHPNFVQIAHALVSGGDPEQYLDITVNFRALSDRVTIDDLGVVRYDGVVIHSTVTDAIERYVQEGRDTDAIVKFLERVQENPSEVAREELFDWIEHQGLTINEDGWIVAHKSVHHIPDAVPFKTVRRNLSATKLLQKVVDEGGLYRSHSTGEAAVDGVKYDGYIPNYVGAVVTMPRDVVDPNGGVDCSVGLHIGTFNYAHNFSGDTIVEVKVDPADVVSVPRQDTSKLRCCKYEVIAVQDKPTPDLSHHEPEATGGPDEDWETLEEATVDTVPKGFWARLREKRKTPRYGVTS